MAEVFAMWHGGSSYSHPEFGDLERFPSARSARDAFVDRRNDGYWRRQDFTFTWHGDIDEDQRTERTESTFTPCVSDSSYLDVFLVRPFDGGMPDYRLEFGPRGGVRRESF